MASHRMLGEGGRKAQILFRFGGRQFSRTIAVRSERDAERAASAVEEAIQDVARGKLAIPEGADVATFLFSGGKVADDHRKDRPRTTRPATVGEVFARYDAELTTGAKQASTRETEQVHVRHFLRIVGADAPFDGLGLAIVQQYADRRAREKVARVTIGKELATVRFVWEWAARRGIVASMPGWTRRDVTLPKGEEKAPFLTWGQIDRIIATEGPDGRAIEGLWERLWLDEPQTKGCLAWVAAHARHPFLHPMFTFAAYTGARRSEIIRSLRSDWDFAAARVAIRQKKADTSRAFTRRSVTIHPELARTMQAWFARCEGSRWAISTADGEPIGPRMASKYFRDALRPGPWKVLHGWHVFRHSLASNMASAGKDQRVIDEMLGHSTDEMSRRYRHLLPAGQEHAIHSMYGPTSPD